MRRRAVLLTLFFLAFSGCEKKKDPGIPGSGVQVKKTRSVPAFKRLWVGGVLEVRVTVGKDGPMELRGDDNLLEHVTSRLENGVMKIDTDAKLRTKMPLEVWLHTAELDSVSAVVASKVDVQGLKAKKFEARAAGAGKIKAAGTAEELVVSGKSATEIDLSGVPAATASVVVSQAATARFGYLEKLDVKASGPSRVIYQGDPDIEKDIVRPAMLVQEDR